MLAAPIINGTLPAFYVENGIATIAVPFSMNRAVNKSEIQAFSLKLKNVQGSSYLLTKSSKKIDYTNNIVYFELIQEYRKIEVYNKNIKNYYYLEDDKYIKIEIKDQEEFSKIEKPLFYFYNELENFYVGLFYKAQLAYIDLNEIVGYYSTVGIIKYTTKPKVSILHLKKSVNNGHIYNYTGLYNQYGQDTTEKVYSYCFTILDMNDNIIEDTGWLIHNNSTDVNQYESFDSYNFNRDLVEGEKFKIIYKIKTNNNLEISSPSYKIMAKKTIQSNLFKTKINANLNSENAYITITLKGENDEYGYEKSVSGYYLLSRSSEDSNYTQWNEIDRFSLAGQRPSKKSWKDFTIEQGKHYQYSIQQYNDKGLFSERIYSEIIYSDFEHIFLYDGDKQLKIKYNPKISSFKIDKLEAKIDTLGSKYPFIFRNGNVEYKEFPISGLISYHMDEEGLFLFKNCNLFQQEERELENVYYYYEINDREQYKKEYKTSYIKYKNEYYSVEKGYELIKLNPEYKKEQYNLYKGDQWKSVESEEVFTFFKDKLPEKGFYKYHKKVLNEINFNTYKKIHTNLTADNLYLEREFKLEVLNWLSNGKPKLFKSPVEGNYLVRLMNVSLNPTDSLGRMIHTFNSTAYEIAENNYESLLNYGIIKTDNISNMSYMKYMTLPLLSSDKNFLDLHPNYKSIYGNALKYATDEIVPNGAILNNFTIEDITPGTKLIIDGQEIIIGSTGTYSSQIPVSSVIIPMKQIEITNEAEYKSYNLYDENGNLINNISYWTESDKYNKNSIYYITNDKNQYIINTNITDEETYNLEKNGRPIYFDYKPNWDEKVLIELYDPYYYMYYIPDTESTLKYIEIRSEEEFEKIKQENNGQIYGPMFAESTDSNGLVSHTGGFWFYKPSINKYIKDTLLGEFYYPEEGRIIRQGRKLYEGANGIYYIPQQISGQINIAYEAEVTNTFNNILNANTYEIYAHQFIGKQPNIIKSIENVATKILNIYDIKAYQRPLEEIVIEEAYEEIPEGTIYAETIFYDEETGEKIVETNLNEFYINIGQDYEEYVPMASLNGPSHNGEHWGYTGEDWQNNTDFIQSWIYYKKIINYKIKHTDKILLQYENLYESGNKLLFKNNINPLNGYYYQVETSINSGVPLMKLVNFKNISNSEPSNRDLKERSASNPMIMDIKRDYELLVRAGKLYYLDSYIELENESFYMNLLPVSSQTAIDGTLLESWDINKIYCMPVSYKEIVSFDDWNSETGYFSNKYLFIEDYNDFKEFLNIFNPNFIQSLPLPWENKLYINGNLINITDSKHFSTGNIGTIESLETLSGIYCELYYQKQEIDYDILNNSKLQAIKNKVDEAKRKLSREYMEDKCITAQGESQYIFERNQIIYGDLQADPPILPYNKLYENYIILLEEYLKKLDKEGLN